MAWGSSKPREVKPKRFLTRRKGKSKAKDANDDKSSAEPGTEKSLPLLRGLRIVERGLRMVSDAKRSASECPPAEEVRNNGQLDWSKVPADAHRYAGILIVVTSPEGKVKVAV